MLNFLIGLMVGGMFGVFIMCLMTAASGADEQMERFQGEEERQERPARK